MRRAPESIPWWPDLSVRHHGTELMDDPESDPGELRRTLRQFPFLNRFVSRSRYLLNRYILADIRRRGLKEVQLLDVGAGAGDIARYLVTTVRRVCDTVMHVDCCEADPRVAEFARRASAGYPTITVLERSVFDLSGGRYDYVISNHFLHHLSGPDIVRFLDLSRRLCTGTLLCNDLERSRISYSAYRIAAPTILRGSFAAYDGALSIRRGFLREELEAALFRSAWSQGSSAEALGAVRVGRIEPGRVYLVARKR
ncbi:MAG: methyltransferase [Alkalispirochaeta sp.]